MSNPAIDTDITSYIATGKPTIQELASKGKFTTKTVERQVADVEIMDPALKQVDKKHAEALQLALNKTAAIDFSKNVQSRPRFEYDKNTNILTLNSYGLKTPIWVDAEGTYRVA